MMYVNSKYSLSKVTSSYKLIDIFPERRRRRRLGHSPTHLQTQLPPPIHHPFPLLLYMTLPLLYTALYPAGPLSTRKCHHDYFISIQCDLGDNIVRLLRPHSHQIPGFSWYALFFMQEEVCIKKCSLCPSPSTPPPRLLTVSTYLVSRVTEPRKWLNIRAQTGIKPVLYWCSKTMPAWNLLLWKLLKDYCYPPPPHLHFPSRIGGLQKRV